jgi:hypothetical protein
MIFADAYCIAENTRKGPPVSMFRLATSDADGTLRCPKGQPDREYESAFGAKRAPAPSPVARPVLPGRWLRRIIL